MPCLLKSLLLCLLVAVWSANDCALGMSSRDYMNLRLKQTRDWLKVGAWGQAAAEDESGKWNNLWSRSHEQPLRAVNLFDETFIIDERRQVLSVALNSGEANNTREEHQLNLASPNQAIKFVKSYFRNDLSLLIVCQVSYCTHYRAVNSSSLQHEQSIEYPGLLPVDAAFFTHADKPHLVIAYHSHDYHSAKGPMPAPSKIYQWNGARMVSLGDILLTRPKSVVTFHSGLSTFLLFTVERAADAAPDSAYSVIFQLDESNLIRRLGSATSTANMHAVRAIHPYDYAKQQFFLAINALGSADILRWNGAAFERLANLPNILIADQIRMVQIDNQTLLLASYADALCVYQMEDKKARHLADLALPNGQRVIEMTAWKYGADAIMLLLVKMNAEGTFQTELWQLNLGVEQTDVIEGLWACLRALKAALDSREAAIEHFQAAQLRRDSFESNEPGKLYVADLQINGGNLSLVEFRRKPNATVASPRQMKEKLVGLRQNVSALKDDVLKSGVILWGNASVDSEARIEELYIGSLEASYVNGKRADLENYLISGIDQQFSRALNVKKLSVDELSVSSLCGYGFDHWMQVNDSARSSIGNLKKNINGSSIIVNDTIVIESDLLMTELSTRRINGIDWQDFLENLFIIGKEQTIKGAVHYRGILQVTRLHSDKVNNVSSSDLISKPSNQSLQDVFINALEVEQLYVQKINGVPIDAAARMSRENIIKGKLTLGKLVITDELSVEESIAIPLVHPTQVYDRLHVHGHVFLKNLELVERATVNIGGETLRAHLRDLVANSWTKSTDQLIEAPMTLRRGASIDQLACLHLNGLAERDFLYTDSAQLSDLHNLTFAHFHFRRALSQSQLAEPSPPADFLEETDDSLTFRRAVRMRHLAVDGLFADKYNGIPIESIMRPSYSPRLPDDCEFEAVRVVAGMSVEELGAQRLNSRSLAEALAGALRTDRAASLHGLVSVDSVHLASPRAGLATLNGRDLGRALAGLEEQLSRANSSTLALTLEDGAAIAGGGLQVELINGEGASDYVRGMRGAADPSSLVDLGSLVSLTVVEDLEVGQLVNGRRLDDELFAGALSRGGQQTLTGRVKLADAQISYLAADAINGIDLAGLMYVDRPVVIHGNVSFARLCVQHGHVTSHTFNGQPASELGKLRRLPTNAISNLLVQADVEWDEPSSDLRALSRLLDQAVTKHDNQLVASPITFEKPVVVESLHLSKDSDPEICRKISEIISDTVIDAAAASNPISVRGTKIFKQGLIAGNLQVDGNIDIKYVNGLDIHRVSSRIFQKDKTEVLTGAIAFVDSVEIGRLLTRANIHGVALQQLAVVGQKMPKTLHFERLHVDGKVSLHKLDGLGFDDFIKRRVTLDEDNQVFVDVQFEHSVRVLNATVVVSINQVAPESLVLSNAGGIPIMVHGNKIFRSRLIVEQNMETSIINDFQVDSIYANAVLNGTNADIFGISLVFEGGVEMYGNMSVSGEIHGLSEKAYLPNRLAANSNLSKETTLLNDVERETRTSAASVLLYLEEERKLDWHFARVESIKSLPVNNKTRLEIVTAEVAELCGLPSDCSCRKQYTVDVLPSGEFEIKQQNANEVSHSFYLAEGPYGLKIISEWASYSEQCSKATDEHEHSKIFWFKFDNHQETLRRTPALPIDGYIADAQSFQVDDQLYLIVAIFYNKETRSHATDSFLYQFDLTNGKAYLTQRIPTDGAKTINLFQIPKVGMHVLIGCVKGRAESLLLRFNPRTRQFQMIRTFATGGSKHVASVTSSNDKTAFVILSNPDVRALQVFNYEDHSDTFVDYQILFFESRVTSLGVFYSGDFGQSDAFVVTTTKDGWLYIYEYMFYGKFQQKMSYWADDIQVLTPFRHMSENYLFAGFRFNSTVYKVIQQGY